MFKKATKTNIKIRLALSGASGSGKTFSALAIASHLSSPIALIDTERGSASKYADKFDFDVCELTDFHPSTDISRV
jgi:ATP-dependent protease Clp ATPase subunit